MNRPHPLPGVVPWVPSGSELELMGRNQLDLLAQDPVLAAELLDGEDYGQD